MLMGSNNKGKMMGLVTEASVRMERLGDIERFHINSQKRCAKLYIACFTWEAVHYVN